MIDTSAFTLNFDDEGEVVAPIVDVDRAALLRQAVAWQQAGCSVIPLKMDGSKAPASFWKKYQSERASVAKVAEWFNVASGQYDGFGVVTGEVSGHLEMLELEGAAVADGLLPILTDALMANGVEEAWTDLCNGYVEASAGEGIHFFFRTEGPAKGNTKLARRPAPELAPIIHPETGKQITRIKTLLETRGEGGQVVAAPSAGRTRAKGGAWTVLVGDPSTIPTISVEDRDVIYAIATRFDAMPEKTGSVAVDRSPDDAGYIDGLRPGDDFMETVDWDDERLLGGAGWTRTKRLGEGWGWKRPGKDTPGISATTGMAGRGAEDRLYVFSSSTEFPTEEPLSKFYVYAVLHHDGDMREAARALGREGFGEDSHLADFSDLIVTRDAAVKPSTPEPVFTHSSDDPPIIVPDTVPDDFGPSIGDPTGTTVATVTLTGTQRAHAIALLNRYGDVLRYNVDAKRWLVWDGMLWREQADDGGIAFEYAVEVAEAMPEGSREEIKAKRACLSANGIVAALRLAQTVRAIRVGVDDLDAHGWELSTPAGTIDLRTGTLHAPRSTHLHTKSTTCTPDWGADRSLLLRFLDTTFQGDELLIAYVQRLLGYALIGEVLENVLPVLFGAGQNGKSVLLDAVLGVLGDYGTTMPSRFLVQGAEQTSDTVQLIGKRFAVAIETNEGEKFNESLAKAVTGGDRLKGRLLYRNYVEWTPTHTLVLATNHRLEVPSGGTSFWRRLREIPFNHEVPPADRIPNLGAILHREHGPAVLSWLVDGAVEYGKHGLLEPPVVIAATREYQVSTDTVARFVDEEVVLGGGDHVKVRVTDVRAAYERFCAEAGDQPVSAKALGMQLQKRFGVGSARSMTSRYYTGMRLAQDGEKGDTGVDDEPKPTPAQEFLL